MGESQERQVLPANVKPLHYDIVLEPDFDNFTFEGHVQIQLDVVEASESISLNIKDIELHSSEVIVNEDDAITPTSTTHDDKTETTRIDLGRRLEAGQKVTLSQRFTGQLNDVMAGFYRSSWKDEQGQEHWLGVTQLAATDARRAFPCFDEPALKTTFTITLIADSNLTCLSNMDVASESEEAVSKAGGKRKRVVFNKTPLMSTYLVAFVVGELKVIETNSFRLPVRVFCTPDQDISHGAYSVELAARTLEFYEKEFGIEYPLPKMDMIAVPDFAAGAMENWGLVTYRVVALLLDEEKSSAATKYRVAEVVQHELAHQWFGNLVTMEFWEGLWLNEGFATWMSWYSCNAFYPEWKVWDGYVTDNLRDALNLDSLRSSHPIEVQVKVADEINQIFDDISYAKGSSVIRMISKYLGEDVFMEGIRRYLKRHAYGSTFTSDLWDALSDASGKDVQKIAATWTKEVGFPVVTVTEDAAKKSIHLKQNRFLRTGDVKPEDDKTIYPIILGLRTKDGVNSDLTLLGREDNYEVSDLDFFKLNAEHSGIYRTLYSPERLVSLGKAATSGLLPVSDRTGMIADAASLAEAGYQGTSDLLKLLQSFENETDFPVWDEIISSIGSLKAAWLFEDEKVRTALKAFQRSLVSKKAHELGWAFKPDDGHIEQQFKALMFSAACSADDEKATAAAFEMFQKFTAGDRTALHPNLRKAVFATVIRLGTEAEYDAVVKEYETAKTSSERNAALVCLGAGRSQTLIKRTLDYAFSSHVKSQDVYIVIGGLRSHPDGVNALWAWEKEKWETLRERFPSSIGMLGSILQMAIAAFTNEEQKHDVEEFFKAKGSAGVDMDLAQGLDAIKVKQGWLQRGRADVEGWLKSQGYMQA
ncbi:Aminopeptidase 2 [Paramyrothecium foliicola]|nr:Aminopeptidase 2 [Paramyrothecium foliicola]